MRRVLVFTIFISLNVYPQDSNQFQHQGLVEQASQDTCKELGSDRCKNQGREHANDMEKYAELGYKAAFNYLVPGTLIKTMLSADPQANLKKLWDFRSITAEESIRKYTDSLWEKEAQELGMTVDECKIDDRADELRRQIATYNPKMAEEVYCKPKPTSCSSGMSSQNDADSVDNLFDSAMLDSNDTAVSNTLSSTQQAECDAMKAKAQKNADKLKKANILEKICEASAIVGVGAVWVAQKTNNRKISAKRGNKDRETTQVESLYAVSELHEGKRKNAITLTSVFGGVAACYATVVAMKATIIQGKIPLGESILKFGLSGFVAYGYGQSIKKHKEISVTAKNFAEAFPKAGACEPGSTCFCLTNAESSQKHHAIEYDKHCKDNAFGNTYFCVDRHGKYDPECKCRASNSCIDQTIQNVARKYGLSSKTAAVASRAVSRLTSGRFNNNTKKDEKTLKVAQNVLKRYAKRAGLPKNLKLSKNEIGKAKAYKKGGLPSNIAMVAAKAKVSNKDKNNLGETPFSLNSYKLTKRARGLKKSGSKQDQATDFLSMFGLNKKKSREPSGGVEFVTDSTTMSASRQAVLDKASINYNPHEPIFNIISGRYLRTPQQFLSC